MAVGQPASLPLAEACAITVSEVRERALGRSRILEAFDRLDRKLERLRLHAVVHLAGSAPLLLDGSRLHQTRDVDVLRVEHAGGLDEFASAVRETAKDLGITLHWLNWDVSLVPGMPPRTDGGERIAYEGKCLTAISPSDRQLLAMKFRVHRQHDWEDMRILAPRVGASTFEQMRDIHKGCFPHSPYSEFPRIAKEYLNTEISSQLFTERGPPCSR